MTDKLHKIIELKELGSIHSSNIIAKTENKKFKIYKNLLNTHIQNYLEYRSNFLNSNLLVDKVKLYNDFREKTHHLNLDENQKDIFTHQSKFKSSIMEDFFQLLFKPLADKYGLKCGNVSGYSQLTIDGFDNGKPTINLHTKNQDISLYKTLILEVKDFKEKHVINVPVISFECKTYIDSTMLDGLSSTAYKIKQGSSIAKYIVIAETNALKKTQIRPREIDRIYITKKCKHINKKDYLEDVKTDVIEAIYNDVEAFLSCLKKEEEEIYVTGYI